MKRLLLIPLLFTLCSCWDYTEPVAQNYVLGFSVDYIDDEFDVCIETVKVTGEPQSLSASDGIIIESRGVSIFDAVRDAIVLAGKKLYWGHVKVIILSETVAKEHLHSVVDVISRSPDIYSNVNLAVSRNCLARDVMYGKTPGESMVSVYISNIIENEEPSQRFKSVELWQLKRDFPYTLIPAISIGEHLLIDGCGVIENCSMTGYLTGTETQIATLLTNSTLGGYLPCVKVDNATLSLEILHTRLANSNGSCRVDMQVALLNSDLPIDTKTVSSQDKIERAAEAVVKEQIDIIRSKPFGKILGHQDYDIHVTLNNTGLKRG